MFVRDREEVLTMAIAYYADVPNVTPAQAQQVSDFVNARLGPNTPPEGGRFHADGPTSDGGWWQFDLWESAEHFTRFYDAILAPAITQVGLDPGTITLRQLEVKWDSTQVPQGGPA